MKVTVIFEHNKEEEGFDGVTTYTREDVEDIYGLAATFQGAASAAGYTYVDDAGFLLSDGQELWGQGSW